jgi:hypothetical protein
MALSPKRSAGVWLVAIVAVTGCGAAAAPGPPAVVGGVSVRSVERAGRSRRISPPDLGLGNGCYVAERHRPGRAVYGCGADRA